MAKLVSADLTNNNPCILYYTTTDKKILSLKDDAFDANMLLHKYDECGVIIFDKPIVSICGCRPFHFSQFLSGSITDRAFVNCTTLESVIIPDSVTEIGESAFDRCSNLTRVTIPDSVTSIGNGAFSSCFKLTEIIIPNSVVTIGFNAFACCRNLQSITFPNSVISIGGQAFYDCIRMVNIIIPNGVTSIGAGAFKYCRNLASIILPKSVRTIGDDAFMGCEKLQKVELASLYAWYQINFGNGTANPCAYGAKLHVEGIEQIEVNIPTEITYIKNYTFYGCKHIEKIVIPNSVSSIGDSAFYGCSGELIINSKIIETNYNKESCPSRYSNWLYGVKFTQLTINNNINQIGSYVFSGCKWLTRVVIPSSVAKISEGAFETCENLNTIFIPNSVTKIDKDAFSHCFKLKNIHISDLTAWCKIDFNGRWANPLHYANNLYLNGELVTELTIPSGITEMKNYVFCNYNNLTSISIPHSVTTIGGDAFNECCNLTTIFINSKSITKIERGAFSGCKSLNYVCISDLSAWCKIDFNGYGANPFCYANNLYLNGELITKLTIPSDITEIKRDAFCGCNSLISVTIGNGITSIGDCAFSGCSRLENINIPNGITYIGNNAFSGCSSLTCINIPNSVTSIGDYTFSGCSSLTCVNIPNSITSIGNNAFCGCSGLTSAIIGQSVTFIGISAFANCGSLTSITIPNSVISISREAFSKCSALKNVIIGDCVANIEEKAFEDCKSLRDIIVPHCVTTIATSAFVGCSSLPIIDNIMYADSFLVKAVDNSISSCNISKNTRWIGDEAFVNCGNLTHVNIPDNVLCIGIRAFKNCSSIENIVLGENVSNIGEEAFYSNSNALKTVTCKAENPPMLEETCDGRGNYTLNTFGEFDTLIIPNGCELAYAKSDWNRFITNERERFCEEEYLEHKEWFEEQRRLYGDYEEDYDAEYESYLALGGDPEKYHNGGLDDFMDSIGL